MNKFRKMVALLLSLCLMAGATLSLAESAATAAPEVTEAVAVAPAQLNDTDVVARVNGQDVTWGEVTPYYTSLVSYYGEPDASMVEMYRAFAMETAVVMALSKQTAAKEGLDQYTEEEKAAVLQSADTDWQAALDNWVSSNKPLTDASTAEEKAAAYKDAEAYYLTLGYDQAKVRADYLERDLYNRVNTFVTKDVVVTDEAVQAKYDENVARDQQLYENDVNGYEQQVQMYNNQYASELPYYHPAGYRYIKHILLAVDDTLKNAYVDMNARLEEQMDAETEAAATTEAPAADATEAPATDTPDPALTPEPTQTPVTQADVDAAKAAILASVQTKIDEIAQKVAAGADFDALITEYAVNADGSATDPGMTSGSYPNGYEVALASTTFVPEFVAAAFSVDAIGDVSGPYVSDYGVHIVKYVSDVPAGPVELTDTLKDSIRTALVSDLQNQAMDAWQKAATVEYTGLIPSMDTLQGSDATAE